MLIQTTTRAKPAGVVVAPGPFSQFSTIVTFDDFNSIVTSSWAQFTEAGSGVDLEHQILQPTQDNQDFQLFQTILLNVELEVDTYPDADSEIYLIEQDTYNALELSDDVDCAAIFDRFRAEEGWSISRYSISGFTKDGFTNAIIAGVTVRVYFTDGVKADTLYQTVTSDGTGAFTVPVFDPSNQHMIAAHSGASPAGVSRRDVVGV